MTTTSTIETGTNVVEIVCDTIKVVVTTYIGFCLFAFAADGAAVTETVVVFVNVIVSVTVLLAVRVVMDFAEMTLKSTLVLYDISVTGCTTVFVLVGVDVTVVNNVDMAVFVFVVTGTLCTDLAPYIVAQVAVVDVDMICALEATTKKSKAQITNCTNGRNMVWFFYCNGRIIGSSNDKQSSQGKVLGLEAMVILLLECRPLSGGLKNMN